MRRFSREVASEGAGKITGNARTKQSDSINSVKHDLCTLPISIPPGLLIKKTGTQALGAISSDIRLGGKLLLKFLNFLMVSASNLLVIMRLNCIYLDWL
jgi:hypothetical protein